MLNILQIAGTQTEFRSTEVKPLPKLDAKAKQYPRRYSMKPYYYNDIGKICSNPVPSLITSSTNPESPLKYRTLGIKFEENKVIPQPRVKKPFHSSVSPCKINLRSSLNTKEIFVIENGSNITQQLTGFPYTLSRSTLTRKEKEEERENFLEHCRLELGKHKRFKYIFSVLGKVYNFLQEIPYSDKVVIVSPTAEFKGIIDLNSSDLNKSVALQVEDKFSTKTSTIYQNKTYTTQFFPNHTTSNFSKTSRSPKKLSINDLKIRLGQIAVKIDTELPKLFDIGMDKLKKKCSFSESEIHKLYAKYKMLLHLSIAKDPNHNIKTGISKEIFIESYYGTKELNFVLSRIFDCIDQDHGGTISWDEYLTAMEIMFNGSYEQQIDLFFRVYDYDGNGSLSFEEIRNLCKLQLQNSDADNVIEELSTSFATLIFNLTETTYDKEISAEKIKEVLSRHTDKSLIEMFCSFSFMKN